MNIRSAIASIPVLGPAARKFYRMTRARKAPDFTTSSAYWEQRYARGGNSGAGSYNQLAEFKAEVLNRFVVEHDVKSVIEFGSGDGEQLKLARYPSYIGVDVSPTILDAARSMFSDRADVTFVHSSEVTPAMTAELSLSLDVIYHLVEDPVYETYMRDLFAAGTRYVAIYASNEDKGWSTPHVRHRNFTRWIESNAPGFRLIEHIPNRYPFDSADPDNTSFADFYIYERVSD